MNNDDFEDMKDRTKAINEAAKTAYFNGVPFHEIMSALLSSACTMSTIHQLPIDKFDEYMDFSKMAYKDMLSKLSGFMKEKNK